MQNYLPQYPQMRTGYYNNPVPTVQQPQVQFKTIPVTNRNEADAFIPDVNGSPLFFFNRGSNEIYLKQLDLQTGLAIFKEYVEKQPAVNPTSTITVETLNEKIDALKDIINQLTPTKKEKVTKNAE